MHVDAYFTYLIVTNRNRHVGFKAALQKLPTTVLWLSICSLFYLPLCLTDSLFYTCLCTQVISCLLGSILPANLSLKVHPTNEQTHSGINSMTARLTFQTKLPKIHIDRNSSHLTKMWLGWIWMDFEMKMGWGCGAGSMEDLLSIKRAQQPNNSFLWLHCSCLELKTKHSHFFLLPERLATLLIFTHTAGYWCQNNGHW